jgi:O-antigen ligase/tetratricopeptide (TPR) repeat protein
VHAASPATDSESAWTPLRRLIVSLVALKVAGIILFFDPYGLQAFDVPKTLLSHGLAWLIAGCLLVALLRHGTAIVPRTPLHIVVAAYAVVVALSALAAENPYIALFGDQHSYIGLSFHLDVLLLYFAVAIALQDREDVLTLAAPIGCAAALALLYAFAQGAGLDPLGWPEDPRGRPFSTFGHPDHLGYGLGILVAAASAVALTPVAPGRIRAAAAGIALIALAAAAIVATRGIVLGLLGAGAAILFLRTRTDGFRLQHAVWISALLVAALGVLLVYTPLGERARGADAAPIMDRLLIYASAIDAFRERPLLGYGPDGFAVAYPRHRLEEAALILGPARPQVSAHNWILQTVVSFGAIGLVAQLALLVAGTGALIRALGRAPVLAGALLAGWSAYWVQGLVSVNFIGVDWFPWLALGTAAALTGERAREQVSHRRHIAVIATAAAAMALAVSGVFAFAANRDGAVAHAAWEKGVADVALDAARSAVGRDPGRAQFWNALGLALERAERWPEAEAAYFEAARRATHRAQYWDNLAWARSHQGATRAADAVAAAQRAFAEDPANPDASFTLAEMLREFGDCDGALTHAARAFALYRDGPLYSRALGRAAICAADRARSRAILEGAASADSAEIHAALANLLLADGDRARARAHATRALQINAAQPVALAVMQALRAP